MTKQTESSRELSNTQEILRSIGPFKASAIFLTVVLIATALAEALSLGMILPLMGALLVESGNESSRLEFLRPLLSMFPKDYMLYIVCGLAFAMIATKNLLILFRTYLSKSFLGKLWLHWSSGILDNSVNAQFEWFLKQKHGVILENVLHEPNYASKCQRDLIDLISKSFLVFSITLVLLAVNWQVTLIMFGVGFFICLIQWHFTKHYSAAIGKEKIELHQETSSIVSESLTGLRQLKIFSIENQAVELFHDRLGRLMKLLVRLGVIQILPTVIGEICVVLLILGIIVYYIQFAGQSFAELIPFLAFFVMSAQRLSINLGQLLSLRVSVLSYLPSLKLVNRQLFNHSIREDHDEGQKAIPFQERVTLDRVDYYYDQKNSVFKGLDVRIPKNQITALTGPSGSGKSTICDLLTGLLRPIRGQVCIDGCNLNEFDLQVWRSMIGYVSQESFFFNSSIKDNMRAGAPDCTDEEIAEAAKWAGAHEFIQAFPDGYDTIIGESGIRMSVGQRQRIAIARAIVRNPQILILDEVTSALDSQNEMEVLNLIRHLREKNITIIMVTHRIPTLHIADLIYVMENGEVVESGSYDDLIKNQNLFSRLDAMARQPMTVK